MSNRIIICIKCGKEGRLGARGLCATCYKWEHYGKHPDKYEESKARQKEWYYRNREHNIKVSRIRKVREKLKLFGTSHEQYEADLLKGCAICHSFKKLCIDHDHLTMKYRGILCDLCNKGLGHFQDNKDKLRLAIHYLEKDK